MTGQLIDLFIFAAMVTLVYVTGWFLVALAIKRNDVADVAWGMGFVTASLAAFIKTGNYSFTAILVTILVTIWGLRLSWHIGLRNSKKSEDYRYKAWRDSWGKWFVLRTYFQVFLFQGFLMLLVVSPVFVIYTHATSGVYSLAIAGVLIWVFGFLFESIGDRQLKDFIANPKNKGHVMDKGLWQYTRHPNYFGEVTQWWGVGVIALTCSYGWLGLMGPAVITFLIVKVSGVPLLEEKYKDNPEYQAYKRRTSVLIPLPRKKSSTPQSKFEQ